MTRIMLKKSMVIILALAMVISLLPVLTLSASAAAASLINIKADNNAGYEEGCLLGPNAGTTDSSGNTYAIGSMLNYKTTAAAMASPLAAANFGGTVLSQSNNSSGTIFICKYNSYGALVWAKAIGSAKSGSYTYGDNGTDIKVDSSGNVFITGSFMEKFDFGQDGTSEATGLTGNGNGFVAKLNSSGVLQWVIPIVTPSGGSSADALALDGSGNVYVTGSYNGSSTVKGTDNAEVTFTTGTGKNIYVMELTGAGIIQWAQTAQSGGSGDPISYDISVSSDGSAVYAVGQSYGLTVSGTAYACTGNTDGYVMKVNGSGVLQWFGTTKGTGYDCVNGVRIDASGNPVIMGWYGASSSDIDPSAATLTPDSSLGTSGSFVAELSPTNGAITWYSGADSHAYFDSLYIDSNGIYIGGYSDNATAYYTSAGSATGSIGTSGTASHLLIKLTTAGAFSVAKTLGNEYPSNQYDKLTDISAADGGGLRIIASVSKPFDIDPGTGTTYAHGTSDTNQNNAMAIFTVTADCASSTFATDTTAPTVAFTSLNSTGKIVTLTFSEALDAATAIAGNFTGTAGTPTVAYTVGATTLTLTYDTAIAAGSGSTIIVSAGVKDVAGNAITSVTFTEGSTSGFSGLDTTAPTVAFTSLNSTGKTVTLTFSEALGAATAIAGNFTGTAGTPTVAYTVGATTLTLTYDTAIAAGSGSTIIVSAGVKDVAGNAITSVTFTEGSTSGFDGVDVTAPSVTKLGDGTKDYLIAASTTATLTFSEALSTAGKSAVETALSSGSSQALSYSWSGAVLTITNTSASSTSVFASDVTASVSDVAGNSATLTLVDSSADETAPTVTKLGAGTKDYSIAASGTATLTFSEALSSESKTAVEAALSAGSSKTLSYSWSGAVLTITNTSSLSAAVFANDVTASVSDVAGNSASLTLVDSSADETAPTVSFTSIDSTGKIVTLAFSEALDYSTAIAGNFSGTAGTPTLSYSEGATSLTLTYGTAISAGSHYTIIVGTGVKDVAGNALAETTFTEGTTSGFTGLDTTAPTILSVAKPSDATYISGQNLDFTVTFSEAVSVNTGGGTPYLTLTVGSTSVHAAYVSGSGSALVFRYTVVSGNADTDGVALVSNITLNGGTIKDAAGNNATVTFTSSNAASVLVDAVVPTISSVTAPSAGTYAIGDKLDFTATFSEDVTVTGSPYIQLTVGSSTVNAVYESGSGTSSLTFRYTIVSGNTDSDGIACAALITLPTGAAVKDAAGNSANLSFTSPSTTAVLVDSTVPTVTGITGPSAKKYSIGGHLDFTATFSENVTVTGSPHIQLTVGSSTVNAVYESGSGTSSLTFRYTIVSGNTDSDGIACAASITLPTGAAIKDAAGNGAVLTYTEPTTSGVLVDGVMPTISSAEIVSDNSYIDIVFSEGVYGAGDGLTALTASKLQIIFTKNSGTATSVTISSIKKNDKSSEASASALTGGETTVRVFLSITGSPSGTETIEIKPAAASSVYDLNGNAMSSIETTGAKTLHTPVSYGGNSSSSGAGAAVIVNGESLTAGTSQTTTGSSGQTTTAVTVDTDKLKSILDSQSSGATVTIPISGSPDVATGTLTGAMVKNMENKDATLVVQTDSGTYTIPASEINIDAVSQQLGESVSLSDINVTVSISEPSASMTQVIEGAAQNGGFTIMAPAVDYTITCTHGSQTVNVSSFNSYVERTIAIPDGVDPARITTGVVVNPDGTVHSVPTQIVVINGKYYAKINSLTNSIYSVIYNPVVFTDVASHWARDAVNDMGSRLVVTGMGNGTYEPDRSITRAEFAAIIVRALGLEPGSGANGFGDVAATEWYSGYIKAAASYGIIKGYDSGNFGPNDTITREQSMAMIARAMKITGLTTDSPDISKILASYSDGASVSAYAEEGIAVCIDTGIVSGRGSGTLAPKASVTRAEVAVMVSRLLQKSELI